ncbi:NADH-quinone oxidoreductase subunit J family protein [Hydrogenimonas urashimensis]|uniref:NADH-quinone oxidoreductase subunit J family protein n=1 Tax=Hydrogenimonas urashimensis TaxID=2740515 RepID=UPI0019167B14|nr:NADH-quinone oxidoreductase subunit J [Hydrogenimonas urashimensis]
MSALFLLTIALILAVASLFIRKTVPAMISFALMMLTLGLFYISLDATLLGLFQIFVYTGGIVVLMLFGITIIGVEFPETPPRPWTAVTAFGLFVAMSLFFLKGSHTLEKTRSSVTEDPGLFLTGYVDTVILFALIAAALLYGTVKMVDVLRSKPASHPQKGAADVRD